ncbi:MAG: SulP family inorganic anion transporter [Verrucomicrobiota bacterium]
MRSGLLSFFSALGSFGRQLVALPRPKFFPFAGVLRSMDGPTFKADLVAGLNVALLAFPMSMAFAMKAGLPIWCGLVGCGVAAAVAPLFSGSANLSAGPTNATAALLLGSFATLGATNPELRASALPTLVLMTGLFLLLASWLRLSGFADFVPRTVISAYIAAAALRVIALQLPIALGMPGDHASETLPEVLWHALRMGRTLINPELGLTIITGIAYFILRPKYGAGKAILGAVAVATFGAILAQNVALTQGGHGDIVAYVRDAAQAGATPHLDFSGRTLSTLFSPALALAVLIVIEGTANARASALKTGRPSDLHQEVYGLGMANIACAFTGGMAASGSISRSALNVASGARTAMASLLCGGFILGALFLARPAVAVVPLSTLAILVILAEIELANFSAIKLILKSSAQDRTVFLATFATALLAPLDVAIFLGTSVAVAFYLKQTSTPEVVEYDFSDTGEIKERPKGQGTTGISILHVEGSLHFGATQAFHEHLRRASADPNLKVLVLKFREALYLDANGVLLLRDLADMLKSDGRHLILCEAKADTMRIIVNAGLDQSVGKENVFPFEEANPNLALAKAVRRARELAGGGQAVLRIVTAPHPDLPKPASASGEDWQI